MCHLAFRVGDREHEQAWKDLFVDLKERGGKEIGLWVGVGNQATLGTITKPRAYHAANQLKLEVRALFSQKARHAADQAVAAFVEKDRSVYPTAIEAMQRDLQAYLTFTRCPKSMERLFGKSNVVRANWLWLFGRKRAVSSCFLP